MLNNAMEMLGKNPSLYEIQGAHLFLANEARRQGNYEISQEHWNVFHALKPWVEFEQAINTSGYTLEQFIESVNL